jgi:Glycosyltransferases involved in cell wall biogenesis
MSQKYVNPNKVSILLSVYNGDKYLADLLDSIINQSCNDFTLYIRDDGATDSSLSIMRDYSKRFDNIVLIDDFNNLGSKYSFLYMMCMIESDYYMFCDQDDVWKTDKVKISLNSLKKMERNYPDTPLIIHTDLEIVDGNLNTIAKSYWKHLKIPVDMPHTFEMMCHFNDVTGCAMAFNKSARNLYFKYKDVLLPKHVYHDLLISLLTVKYGGLIIPVHQSTILFRRHGQNETDPLANDRSILERPLRIFIFTREQFKRYKFYNQFGYGSFLKFVYYKIVTKMTLKIWKRKLA